MYLAFPNLLEPGQRVVILDPMYGEYAHIMENVLSMELRRSFQTKENAFRVDFDTLVWDAAGADLMILVNPNNPTGQYLPREFVRDLLAEISPKMRLCIDETYIDYVPRAESVETWVRRYPQLIVLKSMSKFYALSGARVAYLCASQQIIEHLRKFSPPWAVSLLAQVAAVEALKDEAYYRQKIQETHRLRQELIESLSQIPGLKPYESVANFVLMELTRSRATATRVYRKMRGRGIHIRHCDSQSLQFQDRFIRTAVKDRASNEKIVRALSDVLAEVEND
jgi:histidinol-phosphate/aromatic aminotransferase/cobyric acid decarboxylase-like protein